MTATALAARLNVTVSTISGYESGSLDLPSGRLDQIGQAIELPVEFFLAEPWDIILEEAVSFRKKRELRRHVREKVLHLASLVSQSVQPALDEHFELPEPDLPEFDLDRPSDAATALRNHWSLSYNPIDNLVSLVEAKGVRVFFIEEDSESVDAISFWYENAPYMLLNRRNTTGERVRMNVAHELGHLVLHRDRDNLSREQEEREAWQFAREFLIPSSMWKQVSPRYIDIDAFLEQKAIWGVSLQAMVYMSHAMGMISDYAYKFFWRLVGVNKWKKNEPDSWPIETSRIHEAVLSHSIFKHDPAAALSKQLYIDKKDVVELMPTYTQANYRLL